MGYRPSRRCEDCGRNPGIENLNDVKWTYTEDGFQHVTWLTLCTRCSKVMAKAFAGDLSSVLAFHPY